MHVAGDRVDVPGGHVLAVEAARPPGDDTHVAVVGVAEHEVACVIGSHHRPGCGQVDLSVILRCQRQPRLRGRSAVAGVPRLAGPGDRVDVARDHGLPVEAARAGRHHPHLVVPDVSDDQVAVMIHGQPAGRAEAGPPRRDAAWSLAGHVDCADRRGQPSGAQADPPDQAV